MWNTTDEVTAPVGGPPVYRIGLIDALGNATTPSTFSLIGNQENTSQLNGRHHMVMNPVTGEITAGAADDLVSGTHTDAAFWDNIPAGTKQIIVYGNLPALNTSGDGVGYYFAEVAVPEPTSMSLIVIATAGMLRRQRR